METWWSKLNQLFRGNICYPVVVIRLSIYRAILAYLSWLCYISDVLYLRYSECYSESQLYLYG